MTDDPAPAPGLTLRPAQADDAPAIAALIRPLAQAFVDTPEPSGAQAFWASVSAESERGYIVSPRYRFTVAMQADGLAGFVAVRDGTHLFHLFVAPDLQAQALADAAGAPRAPAFTVNASLPAVGFYQRLGFVAQGEVAAAHGIRFQPMRLDLSPGAVRAG